MGIRLRADVIGRGDGDRAAAEAEVDIVDIERRGIPLDDATMTRLGEGVNRAAAKGSRSSLVVVDDSAFVVSVPNRTVITAVDREHMKDQVFTNIDSAVIA